MFKGVKKKEREEIEYEKILCKRQDKSKSISKTNIYDDNNNEIVSKENYITR